MIGVGLVHCCLTSPGQGLTIICSQWMFAENMKEFLTAWGNHLAHLLNTFQEFSLPYVICSFLSEWHCSPQEWDGVRVVPLRKPIGFSPHLQVMGLGIVLDFDLKECPCDLLILTSGKSGSQGGFRSCLGPQRAVAELSLNLHLHCSAFSAGFDFYPRSQWRPWTSFEVSVSLVSATWSWAGELFNAERWWECLCPN